LKFKFKIQQYQTDAVNSVVNVFAGQPFQDKVSYIRDLGIVKKVKQTSFYDMPFTGEDESHGFENAEIEKDLDVLKNIREIQTRNNIKLSDGLIGELGKCTLDIEMETGTGKTYVYIKTIFELNKQYGWSKFIVVVPSIAIREGVLKSFEITQEHFMEHYGKKIRFFVYNSKNLTQLDNFSSNSSINVMIINIQAFNTSLKEDGKSKELCRQTCNGCQSNADG
jgi:type III restriction enzyme